MATIVFYVSLALTIAGFALFAWLAVASSRKQPAPPPTPGVVQQGGLPSPKDIADLAEKLAKAGPMASAATLTIVFLFTALVASGLLSASVGTN